MKIYILAEKEGWITDVLEKEWIEGNKDLYTTNYQEADIIWVLSDYIIRRLPLALLMRKKVITTIHHMVPNKMTPNLINHYKYLDKVTNLFQTNNDICKEMLSKYVTKPIIKRQLWINTEDWYPINDKEKLREEFNLPKDKYLIGSFQKDTEGASIANKTYLPKLEKGPDQFINIIKKLGTEKNNIEIVLTGFGRQYIIRELNKLGIKYYYFNMIPVKNINKLYQCLDLYVVASRYEGGPRSIIECAANKTPIISTNVGIAPDILAPESIFNMDQILDCENSKKISSNIAIAYNNAMKYKIPECFKEFNEIFDMV
jgi:glycosyltransferase involved in cell wall biosynthesis